MADAGLDDFFAKKDKSKKKPKKQIIEGDNVTQSEEPKKLKKKKEKKKDKDINETQEKETQNKAKEETDWVDFEEEKEADYTGLKIGKSLIKKEKEEEDENEEEEDVEDGEDGEPKERKQKAQPDGPWMQMQNDNECIQYRQPEPEAPPAARPVLSGKYVPPSLRGGNMDSSSSRPNRRKKTAPNLNSDMDFPTLGLGGPSERDGGRFEEVGRSKNSSRQTDDPQKQRNQQLELGNKFGALQDNTN